MDSDSSNDSWRKRPTVKVGEEDRPRLTEPAKDQSKDDTEMITEDMICGLGSWHPACIQRLANPKVFLTIFCILGILEGASFSYTIGVLSTLEKRYAFDSRVSGIILIADNLSSIFISIIVGYYGAHVHRPRWIAAGMMIVAFASYISALPYFIYGPGLHLLNRQINLNKSSYKMCDAKPVDDVCDADASMTSTAVAILFFGNLLVGFGYTAFYTVGTAYIDDGVRKKNSPIYFSTQMALRLLGPSLGYVLASYSLRFYENPLYDPGLGMTDPRWVGAWWIGFIFLGTLLFFFSLPMFLFPKRLPGSAADNASVEDSDKLPKIKDMPKAFLRILKNRVWFFHTLAIIFHVNGYMGYYVLMPRYMEHHYKQTASGASFFSGSTAIVTMIVGIMAGGIVISKFRPRPRVITGYMVGISLFSVLAMMSAIFLPCPQLVVAGTPSTTDNTLNLENPCNLPCECTRKVFQPICAPDGVTTYFSPCYAGCSSLEKNENQTLLHGCRCMDRKLLGRDEGEPGDDTFSGTLLAKMCPFHCQYFLAYILVMSISKMIGSTARVGGTLITLRSVDPKDKNLALGGLSAVLSAFAFIPYPLVFGAIADSTCLVWEEKCGKRGNCWLYDTDKLRNYLHGAVFALILVGTFFDFMVFLYSNRVKNFYGQDAASPAEGQPMNDMNQSAMAKEDEMDDNVRLGLSRIRASSEHSLAGL